MRTEIDRRCATVSFHDGRMRVVQQFMDAGAAIDAANWFNRGMSEATGWAAVLPQRLLDAICALQLEPVDRKPAAPQPAARRAAGAAGERVKTKGKPKRSEGRGD